MSELYQSALLLAGVPAFVAIILGAQLSIWRVSTLTFIILISWYLDGYLWGHGYIAAGPELTGIWGGLTSNIHRLYIEVIAPVFGVALWAGYLSALMSRIVSKVFARK